MVETEWLFGPDDDQITAAIEACRPVDDPEAFQSTDSGTLDDSDYPDEAFMTAWKRVQAPIVQAGRDGISPWTAEQRRIFVKLTEQVLRERGR